ncbi:putative quinol monooxygenase [Naumannella huperziae]
MIFITARFPVQPKYADDWPDLSRAFTEATRAEDGCLWFFWSREVDDPHSYVLVEAFRDGDAGAAHVNSEHFRRATEDLPRYLAATPKIINAEVDGTDWSELGELAVRD